MGNKKISNTQLLLKLFKHIYHLRLDGNIKGADRLITYDKSRFLLQGLWQYRYAGAGRRKDPLACAPPALSGPAYPEPPKAWSLSPRDPFCGLLSRKRYCFAPSYEETGHILKELAEKSERAQEELSETKEAYEQTKVEYERLEQELETLNTRLEELKEKQQQNALSRQQYESQIQILEEQIHAGRQNSDHYRNRLGVLKEELEKREKEKETLTQEKEALHEKLREQRNRLKEENNRLETIQAEVAACTSAVEEGKK